MKIDLHIRQRDDGQFVASLQADDRFAAWQGGPYRQFDQALGAVGEVLQVRYLGHHRDPQGPTNVHTIEREDA